MINVRECREINRVIQRDVLPDFDAATYHHSVIAARAYRKNQGIALRVPYPIGIQAFVENIERSKKSAHGKRDISVTDIVHLGVFERLIDGAGEVSGTALTALEVSFKFRARLKHKVVSKRHQHHRGDDGNQCGITAFPRWNKCNPSRENGRWFRIE